MHLIGSYENSLLKTHQEHDFYKSYKNFLKASSAFPDVGHVDTSFWHPISEKIECQYKGQLNWHNGPEPSFLKKIDIPDRRHGRRS